ncbi:hypothetical protein [Phenylobacterium sp.]|jgi:hypothetical protein|uniref:hypothetical protein n=1 Tax=Phenylobacterium sp. TaxID=1871053 RepID=UPI0037841F4F
MTLRTALLAALASLSLACLSLAACGAQDGAASSAAGGDKYAGLDGQIETWRNDIRQTHKLCAGATCQDFQVACKGERELTADDAAKGVTARLVSAMTFNAQGQAEGDLKPGSSFVEFTKTGGAWTRADTEPVNLTTCAA